MDSRILDLIKSPELIEKKDIELLEKEIKNTPYIQSIRVLQLYGVHKFEEENYQQKLSETAAFTTDKKILYHFINLKDDKNEAVKSETLMENSESKQEKETEPIVEDTKLSPEVLENLDESKENNEEVIVENIPTENKELENSAELNFHGVDDFMPVVNFETTPKSPEKFEMPKQNSSKLDDEMQKLIAEVEAKMKANKKPRTIEEDHSGNFDLNFAENFRDEIQENKPEQKTEIQEEKIQEKSEEKTEWKPANFFGEPEIKAPLNDTQLGIKPDEKISEITTEEIQKDEQSNVPNFINTWQSWLKLGKTSEIKPVKNQTIEEIPPKDEVKNKIIENFIENNPKISKLKQKSSFKVEEKNDNISHLMTETLAKLYAEQKRYDKAIKAYEILKEKHPEKSSEFDAIIQKLKDLK